MIAEVREFIDAHPIETRLWIGTVWVCVSLLVVTPTLWPWAIFADTVAAAMGLAVWAVMLRRQRDKAERTAAAAVAQTEVFADELIAERKRSNAADKAVVRLVAEKLRLSNDLLAAHKRLSDAENVIPLPVQRDGSHDDLAALDAEATAYTWPSIARDAFPVREWGEEVEK